MRDHDPPSMLLQMHPTTYANLTMWLAELRAAVDATPHNESISLAERRGWSAAKLWEEDVVVAGVWLRAVDKKAA